MSGLRGPSPLLRLQSDERLIALTRRGQHAAFETLCSRYQSRLLSFCRHMLGSREDAEDVLQEVFTAAFNAILADEREINVRPWLYRIARNRSLNHMRRASAIGVDSMDVHFADHGTSTGDRVIRRESFRQLLEDVQQLPETQRTALLLREIDALSYEQIAHAMETTVPSVKSLLVRARISLAEAAEARKLTCEEVRLELGQVAEGLNKLSPPARRHVRECERCRFFKRQLKQNNHALAAILPVGPLLMVKKLVLTKLGSTASAGGAHVAGGAGATVGASAGAGAAAGAGATGGAGVAGGVLTAGAGAIATKAVAGLAAAALVTAGAVAADHATQNRSPAHVRSTNAITSYPSEPVVVRQQAQPLTSTPRPAGTHAPARSATAGLVQHQAATALAKPAAAKSAPAKPSPTAATPRAVGVSPTAQPVTPAQPAARPADHNPQAGSDIQVTSEATQLPSAATASESTTSTTTANSVSATTGGQPAPGASETASSSPPAPPSPSGGTSAGPSATPSPAPEGGSGSAPPSEGAGEPHAVAPPDGGQSGPVQGPKASEAAAP